MAERYLQLRDLLPQSSSTISDDDKFIVLDKLSNNSNPTAKQVSLAQLFTYWKLDTALTAANKNVANGFAGLDGSGKLFESQFPSSIPRLSDLAFYAPLSLIGVASGIAGLNSQAKVPDSQIASSIARSSDLLAHTLNSSNPHLTTAAQVGAIAVSQRGAANGVAPLNASSTIDGQYLGRDVAQWNANRLNSIPVNTSSLGDGTVPVYDAGTNSIVFRTAAFVSGNAGSINSASNFGSVGAAIFDSKNIDTLVFRRIDSGSSKLTITEDTVNKKVVLDVVSSNININDTSNILNIAKGGTGSSTQTWVDLTTAQSVNGQKTFFTSPIIPLGTNPDHAAALSQITATRVGNTTAQWNANQLQSRAVLATAPTTGQGLVYNGTAWAPGNVTSVIPDATSSIKGAIVLAGDLAGVASAPQLVTTGVVAGTYNAPTLTIDAKGRVTSATAGIGGGGQGYGFTKLVDSTTMEPGLYVTYNNLTDTIEFAPAKLNLLDDIDQVSIAEISLAHNDLLAYDEVLNKFTNVSVNDIGLDPLTPQYNALYIQGIEVSPTPPSADQVIKFNAATQKYEPTTVSATNPVTGGTNVGTTGVGLYKQTSNSLIEVKKLASTSLTITDDTLSNVVSIEQATVGVNKGGTGITTAPANGQVLIGSSGSFNLATISAGSGISITNGPGTITIANTGSGGGGSGEINTASNTGVGGVGVFARKNALNFEFKNINSASNKITVTNDAPNDEIDLDVVPANLDINTLGGSALSLARGGTGSSTQNFVDLSTTQNINGLKTYLAKLKVSTDAADDYGLEIENLGSFGGIRLSSALPVSPATTGSVYLDLYTATTKRASFYWSETSQVSSLDSVGGPLAFNTGTGTTTNNVGVGTRTPGAKLQVNGGLAVTSTGTAATNPGNGNLFVEGIATISGQNIILNNATRNTLAFNTSGQQAPTLTTRSAGTKLLLRDQLSSTEVDFAIGCGTGSLWYTIPSATSNAYFHAFMGGTTEIMRISGDASGFGRVGIGTVSAGARLQVNGGVAITATATGATDPGAGNLTTSGTVTAGTYVAAKGLTRTWLGTSVDVTPTISDYFIGVNATAAARIVTLPTIAVAGAGRVYVIFKTDTSVNTVTVMPATGEALNGLVNGTQVISTVRGMLEVVCTGGSWYIKASR